MTKREIAAMIESLKLTLAYSDHMWDNKESHVKIIGYLQGTIKGVIGVIGELEGISE